MDNKIENFKKGIFSLRTDFGELAQLMIQKDMKLSRADANSYDLKNDEGKRIEVKFSRAYNNKFKLKEENVIEHCTSHSIVVYDSALSEDKKSNYDCNIEQIKPDLFDILYYGIFFDDKIEVFRANRSDFPKDIETFLNNKEATRKNFQDMHFNTKVEKNVNSISKKNTHKHHREKYFFKDITYEKLYHLLESKK